MCHFLRKSRFFYGKTDEVMTSKANFRLMTASVLVVLVGFAYGREYGGLGTAEQPFLIYTAEEMNDIGNNYEDWDKHFLLENDINLADYTGVQFNIIGSIATKFSGVFDGNGHTISNFTYDPPFDDFVGIFRELEGNNAEIKDLGLIDPNVKAGTGPRGWTGALVGRLGSYGHSRISRCYVEGGSVSGGYEVGGLVGENHDGTISECYATCQVSGTNSDVGGLVGENANNGIIHNCYATGSVEGDYYTGGLVGSSSGGTITNCYSTGRVTGGHDYGGLVGSEGGSVITDSFWDVNSSGQSTSAGGTGKTTTEMKNQGTFTNWDYDNIWKICESVTYPKLRWEKYSGGDGTPEAPCLICSAEEIQTIGANPNDWDKHFKLMANIELGNFTGTQFNIIGNSTTKFTGVFNGNNKQISNFTYSSSGTNYIGLFGYIEGMSAEIKNLGLIDPNIDAGTGRDVGVIVGKLSDNSSVSNCFVENGRIIGKYYVGGLVGYSYYGTITNSYSFGVVSGEKWVGGLVGRLLRATVLECYSISTVSGTGDYGAGGLIGNIVYSTVERCYSDSTVSGDYFVGALIGDNSSGTIRDCYAFGTVSGTVGIGGLLGNNDESGVCTRCYSATIVSGSGITTGGLIGYNVGGPVTDSFWDVNSSGQTTSAGGTGKTTTEMHIQSTFTNWDFLGETINGSNEFWEICEGTNYPKLGWQIPLVGDFVCSDGVDFIDYAVLAEQWELPVLLADVDGGEGDGFVDFLDWAAFANAWQSTSEPLSANWNLKCDIAPEGGDGVVDEDDLNAFVSQWLQMGAYCADIAPPPDGDGVVNEFDLEVFAENWLLEW